jgi:GNAT superfamily N-acetyltransferase
MKTYKQLLEDITDVDDKGFSGNRIATSIYHSKSGTPPKKIGQIHPNYSLHRRKESNTNHMYFIVHDKSNSVVGHIKTNRFEPGAKSLKSKTISVDSVHVDPEHRKSAIGHSLMTAAYKHLHGKGYTIRSGFTQSRGGKSLWKGLMSDPETSKHVRAVRYQEHPNFSRGKDIGKASDLPHHEVYTDLKNMSKKGRAASQTRLVLKRKKENRRTP